MKDLVLLYFAIILSLSQDYNFFFKWLFAGNTEDRRRYCVVIK